MKTPPKDILAAIVHAHRAIACEEAARIEPQSKLIWLSVAEGEHRKKRAALARLAHSTNGRDPEAA